MKNTILTLGLLALSLLSYAQSNDIVSGYNEFKIQYEKKIGKRPELNSAISPYDFQSFYWLKTELVSFCRANGISATGGKLEIVDRIEQYLANCCSASNNALSFSVNTRSSLLFLSLFFPQLPFLL